MKEVTVWELFEFGIKLESCGEEELLECAEDCEDIFKYATEFIEDAGSMSDEELATELLDRGLLEGVYLYDGILYDASRAIVPPMMF